MPHTRFDVVAMLPQPRNYSRAFTGQPSIEDHYFRICLDLLVEDPDCVSPEGDLKSELFRLYRHAWSRANPLERAARRRLLRQELGSAHSGAMALIDAAYRRHGPGA